MTEEWLLVKRGLYYRPNACGYTGIRDHAGRYSAEEARASLSPGISMVRLDSAPEFSEACFDDLARNHLAQQRDEARAENARLQAALQEIAENAIDIESATFAREILRNGGQSTRGKE